MSKSTPKEINRKKTWNKEHRSYHRDWAKKARARHTEEGIARVLAPVESIIGSLRSIDARLNEISPKDGNFLKAHQQKMLERVLRIITPQDKILKEALRHVSPQRKIELIQHAHQHKNEAPLRSPQQESEAPSNSPQQEVVEPQRSPQQNDEDASTPEMTYAEQQRVYFAAELVKAEERLARATAQNNTPHMNHWRRVVREIRLKLK